MRRTCERPGCGQPTAVVYGMSQGASGSMTLWIDRFVPDGEPIDDVRGALCVMHGERLTAPVGWSFEDRRERAPRLFKPSANDRPNLAVVPEKAAKTRRERAKDLPRPSLFGDERATEPTKAAPEPHVETAPAAIVPVETATELEPLAERTVTPIPKRPVVVPDPSGDVTRSWVPHFDPDDDLDGMLDATGPMLRDAFRARHNGRVDD